MTALSDFQAVVRTKFFARVPGRQDFHDPQLGAAIVEAVQEYSRYRPRRNLLATVNLTSGSQYIDLPANFMRASCAELYYLATGTRIGQMVRTLSVYDSDLGVTFYPPPGRVDSVFVRQAADGTLTAGQPGAFTVRLTTRDTGAWSLLLDSALTATTTRQLVYDGFHEISSSGSNFSVPINDRNLVADLTIGRLCQVLARQMTLSGNPEAAKLYADFEASLQKTDWKMASFGGLG